MVLRVTSEARSGQPIPVALADSNPLMLGALSQFIDRDPRFTMVATAKTAEGFLSVLARTEVAVGIIDWTLPTLSGEGLLDRLRGWPDAPRVVVYGHDESDAIARRAMAAGAAGFCARSEPPEQLLEIVREVAAGRMVFPFVDVRALRHDPLDSLTAREQALIARLAGGASNRDLAADLGISVNTVKFHLRNLYEKLSVNSRTQAVALYYASDRARP